MFTLLRPFRPVLDLNVPGLTLVPNCDLTNRTSMKMNARAAVFAEVDSPFALLKLIETLNRYDIPYFMLGGGKNTLFATSFFQGVVVSLGRSFRQLDHVGPNMIHAGAGVQLPRLLSYARECHLMGLEFLNMVPGTVGGSLAGNAGAGDFGICDFAENVYLMSRDGFVACVQRGGFQYDYRKSDLKDCIVLGADFKLEALDAAESARRSEMYASKKKGQPYNKPSAGCIFKNPVDPETGKEVSAGKLIDQAGLKGYHIRHAAISEMHANFMVNEKSARGEDFLALICLVKDMINERLGITLSTEVQIVGGPLNSVVLR